MARAASIPLPGSSTASRHTLGAKCQCHAQRFGSARRLPHDPEPVRFDRSPDPYARRGLIVRQQHRQVLCLWCHCYCLGYKRVNGRCPSRLRSSGPGVAPTVALRTRVSEGLPGGDRRSMHERRVRSHMNGDRQAHRPRLAESARRGWYAFAIRPAVLASSREMTPRPRARPGITNNCARYECADTQPSRRRVAGAVHRAAHRRRARGIRLSRTITRSPTCPNQADDQRSHRSRSRPSCLEWTLERGGVLPLPMAALQLDRTGLQADRCSAARWRRLVRAHPSRRRPQATGHRDRQRRTGSGGVDVQADASDQSRAGYPSSW